jgi:hypothetical protein
VRIKDDIGILGYWDIGILGYWDIGILGYTILVKIHILIGCYPILNAITLSGFLGNV